MAGLSVVVREEYVYVRHIPGVWVAAAADDSECEQGVVRQTIYLVMV